MIQMVVEQNENELIVLWFEYLYNVFCTINIIFILRIELTDEGKKTIFNCLQWKTYSGLSNNFPPVLFNRSNRFLLV